MQLCLFADDVICLLLSCKPNNICGVHRWKVTLMNKIKEYLNKRRVISMFMGWKIQYCQVYMERSNTPNNQNA